MFPRTDFMEVQRGDLLTKAGHKPWHNSVLMGTLGLCSEVKPYLIKTGLLTLPLLTHTFSDVPSKQHRDRNLCFFSVFASKISLIL